jgi:hypothetical protein
VVRSEKSTRGDQYEAEDYWARDSRFNASCVAYVRSGRTFPVLSTPHRSDCEAIRIHSRREHLEGGEPAVLVLESTDSPRGIRFKELGIEAKVGKGKTSEIAFTPDKIGTFVGRCSVFCRSACGAMVLTLNVT